MWLALSLATSSTLRGNDVNDADGNPRVAAVCFAAWAHLTVFFNLSAILAEALLQRRLLNLNTNTNAPSTRWNQTLRNALHVLPMASWCSMIVVAVATTTGTELSSSPPIIDSVWKLSLWGFLGTFLVRWLIRMSATRRQKTAVDMQGMPTTMATSDSNNNSGGVMARCCGIRPATANYNSSATSQFNNSKQCWLDEGQWYAWNRVQTIQWFVQQLMSSSSSSKGASNDDDDEEKDMVIAILAPHRITGDVLEGLADVSQLVALRVPYGPACRLSDSIAELVDRYPTPQRRRITNQGGGGGSARGGRKVRFGNPLSTYSNDSGNSNTNDIRNHYDDENDRMHSELRGSNDYEYNNNNNGQGIPGDQHQYQYQNNEQQQQQQNDFQGAAGVTEEQHEKLNNVMKERFGLELPKLKATDWLAVQKGLRDKAAAKNNTDIDNNHETMSLTNHDMMSQPQPHPLTVPLPQTQQQFRQNNPSSSYSDNHRGRIPPSSSSSLSSSMPIPGIPDHVLEGMPPKIREVAKRRPDLISTIWKQKQNQVPRIPPNYQASAALPGAVTSNQFSGLQNNTVLPETVDEDYDDSDDEDETTNLIHSRDDSNEYPARYKSIDKSMIPSIV
jgi:hypothetical protein